jgi:lipid A disaccharide synthetase
MQNDIAEFKPDVIIFIDYPGFNMHENAKTIFTPRHGMITNG